MCRANCTDMLLTEMAVYLIDGGAATYLTLSKGTESRTIIACSKGRASLEGAPRSHQLEAEASDF